MKNDNTLFIVAALAVVGYIAFKKGLIPGMKPASAAPVVALPGSTTGGLQSVQSVAQELPSFSDIGLIVPKVDPTGEQLNFY